MYEDENGKPTGQGSVIITRLEEAQRAYSASIGHLPLALCRRLLKYYSRSAVAEGLGWSLHQGSTGQTRQWGGVGYDRRTYHKPRVSFRSAHLSDLCQQHSAHVCSLFPCLSAVGTRLFPPRFY